MEISEIKKNIYQVKIPLPESPLKILNSYIIKGDKTHLLVDVGYNHDISEKVMMEAFEYLNIEMKDTNIFLTHVHGDHTGMVNRLKDRCIDIYISKYDGDVVNRTWSGEYWEESMAVQAHMGIPEGEALHYTEHPAYRGGTKSYTEFKHVEGGEIFEVDDYKFEVIDLKGHTPGQRGLYDRDAKILISGDHILNDITPNINAWDFQNDYLKFYLDSLMMVREMDVEVVLPGHRSIISNHKKRIDELIKHHETRLNAIMTCLDSGEKTIYQVASAIPWDFATRDFKTFPNEQKWFAGNEVFAHLEYLRRKGDIDYKVRDNTYFYYKNN